MYEAYEYVRENGINLEDDYAMYKGGEGTCDHSTVRK